MDLSPEVVLAMWTGGIAAGGAAVAWWRIVGPGFSWLTGASVILFALGVVMFGEHDLPSLVAIVLTLGGVIIARNHQIAAAFFAAAAVALVVAALVALTGEPELRLLGPLSVVTGTLFLGAVTSVMMLGHWYLVDPRLPRWALQRLDVAAGAGLVADFVILVLARALDWVPTDAVLGWAFVALALFTFLLIIAVWYSLQEPGYTGVMAATGLSYLAVLTSFGVVVLGRLIIPPAS